MKPTFDSTSDGRILEVGNGVAAFDPVTPVLAAEEAARKGVQTRLRPELDLPTPDTLEPLAEVSFAIDATGNASISAKIDTGKMKWNLDDQQAESASFQDYTGMERRGVDLGYLEVLVDGHLLVTYAPMKTPKGDPVRCWFAELPAELGVFDGYELLALAQNAMQSTALGAGVGEAFVTVPAQDLKYQAAVGGVEVPDYPDTTVNQRFAAALDEHGARVIAETFIGAGAPPTDQPPAYEFGSRGPVLVWFTQPDCSTPFSIMYTTAEAWPKEDDDIDLDTVTLPAWI